MTADKFKCAMCSGVFDKGRDDAEALAECDAIFGVVPMEDLAIVCDDCFNRMNSIEPFENVQKPVVMQ